MEVFTSLPMMASTAAGLTSNETTVVRPGFPRAEWLVILDYTSTIIMTCNTITLMLAMGAATYWREVWHHVKRPWAALVGMVCQFAFLPALGFGLCVGLKLPPYQALGVLILACSPGGAFSTFFTYWIDGDVALSILMTALSSLLAFGMMPLNLWAYSIPWTNSEISVPYINILISLAFVTVPVIIGMIIRHFNRKCANYISKVCSLLGWVGAVTCGILLILMYWETISKTSTNLVITAALVPIGGVVVAYIVSKLVCFNHALCRTIAIETGCQNMVVATNVMLLSFGEPEVRGQMVIFPVLYGLCQLGEVMVTVGLFQLWSYCHQNYVVEERVKSKVDNSILTSVPVPAHRLSESRIQEMTGFGGTPDICRLQERYQRGTELDMYYRYAETSRRRSDGLPEGEAFLSEQSTLRADEVDDPNTWRRTVAQLPEIRTSGTDDQSSPFSISGKRDGSSEFNFPQSPFFDSPKSPGLTVDSLYFFDDNYDAASENSPTLSNKGVPNMFPVTERDFLPPRGTSPMPYGAPVPVPREKIRRHDWNDPSLPKNPYARPSTTSTSKSPIYDTPKTFGFYHNDIRIGQADNFRTFGRHDK